MFVSRGLAGPKSRRNSSGTNGKQVNIPVPVYTESRRFGVGQAGPSPGRIVKARGSRNGTKRVNVEIAQVDPT